MTYTEIFEEIVSIMRIDSASYPDFGAGDYEKYAGKITDGMDRMEFLHLVQEYLATFGIQGHLGFADTTCGYVGFSVMRMGNVLYVTNANTGTKLTAGDKIIAVDSMPIEEIARREETMLMKETDERQGGLWPSILKYYKNLDVEHENGSREEISIRLDTKAEPDEKYYYKDYGNGMLFVRLADFADTQAITKLYKDCRSFLENSENLIIDVRGNGGGSDTCFLPLLEYCFPEGEPVSSFVKSVYPVAINYSERNSDDRLVLLKSYFGENVPDDVAPMVEKMISDLRANRGKGFVDIDESFPEGLIGKAKPKKVLVLTDEGCGSSGDAFVEIMRFSPKVTVIGRPTLGITDYSNLNIIKLDDFVFSYPTSRDKRIDHNKGLLHRGVPVNVYIPWTPEEICKDVILEYALKQIKED